MLNNLSYNNYDLRLFLSSFVMIFVTFLFMVIIFLLIFEEVTLILMTFKIFYNLGFLPSSFCHLKMMTVKTLNIFF